MSGAVVDPWGAWDQAVRRRAEAPAAGAWISREAWSEAEIPRRPWVVPRYLMRGAVSVLAGPGGGGKSMIAMAWSVALALGRPFGRFDVPGRMRVLSYSVEDDLNEQRRRMSATLRQFEAAPADAMEWLALAGPEGQPAVLRVDPYERVVSATQALLDLRAELEVRKYDVVMFDPFVELHDGEENDNTIVRMVMAHLRAMAREFDVAILLAHHARKGSAGSAGDVDLVRGAGAIVAAARVVMTLLTMDKPEAKEMGVPDEQRADYFRLDFGKANYGPTGDTEWFQRNKVLLDNEDKMVAAWPWVPPQPMRDVSAVELNQALDRIAAGPLPDVLYAPTRQGGADRWCGAVVMDVCGIGEDQARALVGAWLRNGLLVTARFRHPEARREMTGVRVVDAKRPTVG